MRHGLNDQLRTEMCTYVSPNRVTLGITIAAMRVPTLLLLLLIAPAAGAEQSTDSSGDYYMDFGQVYGATVSIQQYRDICAESFPGVRKQNNDAYFQWRAKYLKFLQELEKHRVAMAWKEAKGDEKKHVEVLTKMNASFDRYKGALREQLNSGGQDGFQRACARYPQYLQSDRGNLEYFYAEQVATVRRGPSAK